MASKSLRVGDALRRCPALAEIVRDLHWMARRYADMRQSYAVSTFNVHTMRLVRAGLTLNPCAEDELFAKDAQGPKYEGVTRPEQAACTRLNAEQRAKEKP